MAKLDVPRFQASFLKPKYWGLWLMVGLWRALLLLPYPCLVKSGYTLGWLPGIGVYRPNDNPVLNYLQVRGRMCSNKAMLDRKDMRGMILTPRFLA